MTDQEQLYGNYLDNVFKSFPKPGEYDVRPLDGIPREALKMVMILNRILNYVTKSKSIIVSGDIMSGKSFIIEQLGKNLDTLPSAYERRSITKVDSGAYRIAYSSDDGKSALDDALIDFEDSAVQYPRNKHVLYVDAPDIAAYIHMACPHVSMILELDREETGSLLMKDHSLVSAFEIVDMDDFEMTWESFVNEMKTVNKLKFEPQYDSHLNDTMIEEFLKDIYRLGIVDPDSKRFPKKNDIVEIPIGICVDHLEFLHATMLEHNVEPDNKMMRSLTKEVFEQHPVNLTDLDYLDDSTSTRFLIPQGSSLAAIFGEPEDQNVEDSEPVLKKTKKKPKILPYKDIMSLSDRLKKRIIHQDDVIDRVCETLKIDAAKLRRKDRPVASFIFQGPSGVGKTALAKALADEVFTKQAHFVRLDMSEYSEEYTVSKLFGSAPGLIGSDDGGQLTNEVDEHPQSIILLDEAEKAHSKVWNAFLQVFDSGRMTDGKGKTVDFTNCIFIMTTNLGNADTLHTRSGFGNISPAADTAERDGMFRKSLSKYFLVEFINRLDGIYIFNALDRQSLKDIIHLQLKDLANLIMVNHPQYELNINLDEHTIDWLLDQSDSQQFGARELQRVIRNQIVIKIANIFISNGSHDETDKSDIITMEYDDNVQCITFSVNKKEQ
jgi:DNA replication protein DnaC